MTVSLTITYIVHLPSYYLDVIVTEKLENYMYGLYQSKIICIINSYPSWFRDVEMNVHRSVYTHTLG